jgi:hypothetical protein
MHRLRRPLKDSILPPRGSCRALATWNCCRLGKPYLVTPALKLKLCLQLNCLVNHNYRGPQVLGYIKEGLPNFCLVAAERGDRKDGGKGEGVIVAEANKIWQELEVSF